MPPISKPPPHLHSSSSSSPLPSLAGAKAASVSNVYDLKRRDSAKTIAAFLKRNGSNKQMREKQRAVRAEVYRPNPNTRRADFDAWRRKASTENTEESELSSSAASERESRRSSDASDTIARFVRQNSDRMRTNAIVEKGVERRRSGMTLTVGAKVGAVGKFNPK